MLCLKHPEYTHVPMHLYPESKMPFQITHVNNREIRRDEKQNVKYRRANYKIISRSFGAMRARGNCTHKEEEEEEKTFIERK